MGTQLDASQAITAAFNDTTQALDVSIIGTGTPVDVNVVSGGGVVVAQVLVDGTTINPVAGAKVKIVTSLASAVSSILVFDTTGYYLQLFTGPAGATLLCTLGPGQDTPTPLAIAAGLDVWIRSAESAAITVGQISLAFVS